MATLNRNVCLAKSYYLCKSPLNALPVTVVPLSFWPRADWGVAVREGAA